MYLFDFQIIKPKLVFLFFLNGSEIARHSKIKFAFVNHIRGELSGLRFIFFWKTDVHTKGNLNFALMQSTRFILSVLSVAAVLQSCRWKYEFDPIPTPAKELVSSSDWYLNRDFEQWDSVSGKQYLKPHGWATGNEGTSLIRSEGNCNRTTDAQSGQYAVKLESLRNSFGNSVASATTFLGEFNFNMNQALNPVTARDMTVFGLPIEASLSNKKFDKLIGYYKYTPGQTYVRLNNPTTLFAGVSEVPGARDYAGIYAILERRSNGTVTKIARAEMDSTTATRTIPSYTRFEIPFQYEPGAETLEPTHITIVFASSAKGDFFEGAVGSTLFIDNISISLR